MYIRRAFRLHPPIAQEFPILPSILPERHQRELPLERLILADPPGAEAIEMDVLFVGAGPAGLAGAIELAQLVKKAQAAGEAIPISRMWF